MIRPFTCLAFLLACGSGLYLYQSKHSVHVLDQQIDQTIKTTETLREQTRMLHAEWTLLNDPERLRQLSDQFLTLKTVSPGQFTSLADLDSRLPAPVAQPPADAAPVLQPEPAPLVASAPTEAAQVAQADPEISSLPVPPLAPASPPAARIAVAAPSVEPARPPDRKPTAPRPAIIPPSQPRIAAAEPRPVEARIELQPRTFTPQPVATTAPPQPSYSGSLLGMARGGSGVPAPLPAPRPMPVNATQFVYNQGG